MGYQRSEGRSEDSLRSITITRQYTCHAEGSVLVEFGRTQVLCTASVSDHLPRFLKGKNTGWVSAEYAMLPRATHQRNDREAVRGKQTGRTQEIQRLIGRALRSALDLPALKEHLITIDCDVIQADGGTRTASITGGCVALYDAIQHLIAMGTLSQSPFKHWVAAVSVGVCKGHPVLDLDYEEDAKADTDMNVVMNDTPAFIEVQGTAESTPFSEKELQQMLSLAKSGIYQLIEAQKKSVQ